MEVIKLMVVINIIIFISKCFIVIKLFVFLFINLIILYVI